MRRGKRGFSRLHAQKSLAGEYLELAADSRRPYRGLRNRVERWFQAEVQPVARHPPRQDCYRLPRLHGSISHKTLAETLQRHKLDQTLKQTMEFWEARTWPSRAVVNSYVIAMPLLVQPPALWA
jgi:hypothetical protein